MCPVGEKYTNKKFYGSNKQPNYYSARMNNEPYVNSLIMNRLIKKKQC